MGIYVTFERRPPLAAILLLLTAADIIAMCLILDLGAFVVLAFPVFFAGLHSNRGGRRPGLLAFLCLTPAFGLALLASWSVGVLFAIITIPLFVLSLATALAQNSKAPRLTLGTTVLLSPLWIAFSAAFSFVGWVIFAKIFAAVF